jgi:biopolymer transport protein ExbD
MKFQRRKKEKLDISITSMIDVVFLLLIFFMVTTSFTRQTEVKIKLPEANGAEAEDYPKSVSIVIDTKGDYFVMENDNQTRKLPDQNRETLTQEISKLASQGKDVPFIINADGKTPHQAVMTVLDVAGQVGFSHITFATQEPKTEE